MLLFFLFITAGTLAGLWAIRHYEPEVAFSRRDLMVCAGIVLVMSLLCGYSRQFSTLPLALLLGLLCAGTVTDTLRGWLPNEITFPLCVAALWYVSATRPGLTEQALIWGALWGGLYAVRYAVYHHRGEEDSPGGGDVPLAIAAGICGGTASGVVLTVAITGHLLWGTLRHQHIAPFGPWLTLAITLQLLFF